MATEAEDRQRDSGRDDWHAALSTTPTVSNLANQIGLDIVAGVFAERALLPAETDMRDRYSVSRTALREAYSKLTAKGLVIARPKVGTSVRARMHWNMLDQDVLAWHLQTVPPREIFADLFELRRMIEPAAAERAAAIRTEEDIALIETALDGMMASSGTDLVAADFDFHVAVLGATRNPFINAFSGLIKAAMLSAFEISWSGAEMKLKHHRLLQHGDVAREIRDRNAPGARAAMQQLLDDSIGDIHEALARGTRT